MIFFVNSGFADRLYVAGISGRTAPQRGGRREIIFQEQLMELQFFNTMNRRVEPFRSINPGEVRMYTCGPTVYNYAHIGNLRTYIFEDLLVNTLKLAGYKVKHVMNVTDVGHLTSDGDEGEDKMQVAAEREKKSVLEIARMYGYNHIPSSLPLMEMTKGALTPVQSYVRMIRHLLTDLGLHEVMTYTLTSPSMVDDFNLFHHQDAVALMLPIGEERSVTRKSLIPSLLQAINFNRAHSQKDVMIYEISHTYSKETEIQNLAIACSGMYHHVAWQQLQQKADFYLLKGFVETIFEKLGIKESRYTLKPVEANQQDFHPGRSGYIMMGNDIVGVIGEIHPRQAKKYDVKDVYVAELNLSVLLNLKKPAIKFTEIPQYPSVTRDIALVMDKDIPVHDVVRSICKVGQRLIVDTQIFDIYEGEHVASGQKSVAIALTFQDATKTLDDTTINTMIEQILKVVEKDYGAHLRV